MSELSGGGSGWGGGGGGVPLLSVKPCTPVSVLGLAGGSNICSAVTVG